MHAGVVCAAAALALAQLAPAGPPAVIAMGSTAPSPTAAATLSTLADLSSATRLFGIVDGRIAPLGSPSASALEQLSGARIHRTYGGIDLTLSEAVDLFRGNESVRDAVIARSCGVDGRCGPGVGAAAARLLEDVERDSAAQLEALARLRFEPPDVPPAIVFVTAGLPYRDLPQAVLDRAAGALNSLAAPLWIVRVGRTPPPLRDAWDDLVKGGRIHALDVTKEADSAVLATSLAAPAPAAPASPGDPPAGLATRTAEPFPTGPAGIVDAALLSKVGEFVTSFEHVFAALIWHEVYTQEDHAMVRFSSSGGWFETLLGKRRLESELLFVWLPADATWIAVRDVISVDGKSRAAGERQLPQLLAAGPVTIAQLRTLAAENGRFNVGRVLRTFNEPTLALLFADDRYRGRFQFGRAVDVDLDGAKAASIDFAERQRPTVIRDGFRDLPVTGQLVVDRASGRVLQTRMHIADERERIRGTVVVTYRFDSALGMMVPRDMRETYEGPDRERIDCTAIYSDFRRFQTSGRIIIPQ